MRLFAGGSLITGFFLLTIMSAADSREPVGFVLFVSAILGALTYRLVVAEQK